MNGKQRISVVASIAMAGAIFAVAAPTALGAPGGGGSLPTQPQSQVDPEEAYREGVAALQEGDYKTAEKRFGEVLSVARKHPEANYYMGLAKVGRDKHKSSIRYFKRAIRERSDFIEAREQLALASIVIEKPKDAEEQLAAIRGIRAGCTEEECGAAFMTRADEAIAKVEAALAGGQAANAAADAPAAYAGLAPASRPAADAAYGEAVRLINQARYAEAIDTLHHAHALIGPHTDIFNYLGFSYRQLGHFDKARAYYAAALRMNPDHLGATEYLGELYLERGEIGKARRQLEKLDRLCAFGCPEREDLARRITIKESVRRAAH